MELGIYVEVDGRPAVRFVGDLACSVARLWRAVTDPAELAHWFPSRVELELRVGAPVRFFGDPYMAPTVGTVLVCEADRHLAFTWASDELRFDVEGIDGGRSHFTLTDILTARNEAARNAAGWTVCLSELEKVLVGADSGGPHSADAAAFQPIYDVYVSAGLPSGAPIPS